MCKTYYARKKLLKKVLFISSTGGHLNELLQLKPLFSKYDYHIITEKDKTNEYLKEEYKNRVSYLPYGTRSKLFSYIFKYTYLCFKSVYLYIKIRPKYIVTTGTHTAGPMCYLGKLFGSKIIYIETYANRNRKTATGKLIYPIADLFIVQWEEMQKLYPNAVYGGSIFK
jgi:UDP-N-acetylglucosamine:LPS N-acetylglucosamine transferase